MTDPSKSGDICIKRAEHDVVVEVDALLDILKRKIVALSQGDQRAQRRLVMEIRFGVTSDSPWGDTARWSLKQERVEIVHVEE